MPTPLEGTGTRARGEAELRLVATVGEDGTPQVNPVWIHTENGRVALNSAEGRRWQTNLRRDGRAAIAVPNMENPYEYVSIVGRLVEATHEGADEHIDALAKKYLNEDTYPFRRPGEVRVKLVLEHERVMHNGG